MQVRAGVNRLKEGYALQVMAGKAAELSHVPGICFCPSLRHPGHLQPRQKAQALRLVVLQEQEEVRISPMSQCTATAHRCSPACMQRSHSVPAVNLHESQHLTGRQS